MKSLEIPFEIDFYDVFDEKKTAFFLKVIYFTLTKLYYYWLSNNRTNDLIEFKSIKRKQICYDYLWYLINCKTHKPYFSNKRKLRLINDSVSKATKDSPFSQSFPFQPGAHTQK